MNFLPLLLAAFLPGIEVKIDGPKVAAPGDLVILQAVAPGATNHAWILANSNKTFLPVENGTKAIFASGAQGKYIFVLSASDATSLGSVKHELIIGEPEPEPQPNPPGPTPPPTPLPDGKFKLAAFAFAEASKVNASVRVASSKALASSFQSMAAAIAAGTIKDPQEILTKTLSGNQLALGGNRIYWEPWGVLLKSTLETLHQEGRLRTPDDFATAWREIATGLEAVK